MSATAKASYTVTSRYAAALIDLAEQGKAVEAVESDMKDLSAMLAESSDLSSMIASQVTSRSQQQAVIEALAKKAKFHKLTTNFLGVLVQNRRLYALAAMIETFGKILSERRGEMRVEVRTAQDLSPEQIKSIQDTLAKALGKTVTVDAKVRPDILGGMVVLAGSRMIDDSLARKLERLKLVMKQQANQNTIENTKKEA